MAIVPDSTLSSSYTATSNKRQRISPTAKDASSKSSSNGQPTVDAIAQPIVTIRQTPGAKRPQMKYDPSVPMTKEQTSEWRRIERKKRNRESAAACRKRQRDRIADLEDEVSVWKTKFENALLSLKTIEGNDETNKFQKQVEKKFVIPPPRENTKELRMKSQQQRNGGRCTTPPNTATSTTASTTTNTVSPYDRPKFIPPIVTSSGDTEVAVDDLHFPVLEDSTTIKFTSDSLMSRVENLQHSLPAVKITGAVNPPLTNIESVCDDLLQVVPDSCLSFTEKKTMPFPEACPSLVTSSSESSLAADVMAAAAADVLMKSSVTTSDESIPGVSTDGGSDEDSDLGDFLLDAVNWL